MIHTAKYWSGDVDLHLTYYTAVFKVIPNIKKYQNTKKFTKFLKQKSSVDSVTHQAVLFCGGCTDFMWEINDHTYLPIQKY